jgi:hypothetical protein
MNKTPSLYFTNKCGRKKPLTPNQVEIIIKYIGKPPVIDYIPKLETLTSLSKLYGMDYRTFIYLIKKIGWQLN